jgi:hypothetical protein
MLFTVELHKHNIPKKVDSNHFSKLKEVFSKSSGWHIVFLVSYKIKKKIKGGTAIKLPMLSNLAETLHS